MHTADFSLGVIKWDWSGSWVYLLGGCRAFATLGSSSSSLNWALLLSLRDGLAIDLALIGALSSIGSPTISSSSSVSGRTIRSVVHVLSRCGSAIKTSLSTHSRESQIGPSFLTLEREKFANFILVVYLHLCGEMSSYSTDQIFPSQKWYVFRAHLKLEFILILP